MKLISDSGNGNKCLLWGLECQGGAGKEPEEARGVLNLYQDSDGIDIHICKDIMCRSLYMTTYNLSK